MRAGPPASHATDRELSDMDTGAPAPDGAPQPFFAPRRSIGGHPIEGDYGWYDGELPRSASREELVERMRRGAPTPAVWTPEAPALVPPWSVPYLFEPFREHGRRRARNSAAVWLAGAAAMVALAAAGVPVLAGMPTLLFAVLAVALAFQSLADYRRFARLTPDTLREQVREAHSRPPPRSGTPLYTRVLAGALGAVCLVQWLVATSAPDGWDASVDAAGIVKEAVRAGEWWRLLTGALMHGNLIHLAFNAMALLALGRLIEAFAHRAYVPLVFLVTALAASVASQVLMPETSSVGASGGLMGMFGFLAIMSWRRRELMPPGLLRAIILNVAIIAGMGLVAFGYVDNAAHAGGLLAGVLMGLAMVPSGGREPHWTPPAAIRLAGDASLGVLLIASLATMVLVYRGMP